MAHKVAIINGKAPSGGTGGVSDADLQNLAVNFFTAGVAGATHYKVEQQTTPDMTVKVAIGKAYVHNSTSSMAYQTELDSVGSVTIGANASGNPRIDAVVIKVDTVTAPNSTASNITTLVAVQGTPAASPSAPNDSAIQTAVGAGNAFYRLANIAVANGATSITTANITDTRLGVSLKVLGGYLRYNLSTSKMQFSDDGSSYTDLDDAPTVSYQGFQVNPTSGQTTTSTSYVDMTGGTQSVTLSVTSHVLVTAHANVLNNNSTSYAYIRVTYDTGGADTEVGQQGYSFGNNDRSVTAGGIATSLAAGTYTFAIQKKVDANTGTYYQPSMSIVVLPA
jgi:hypothetical protein